MVSRSKAFQELRIRLNERPPTSYLWNIIIDFEFDRKHSVQHEDRAAALLLSSILEQSLETAIISHFNSVSEPERSELFQPNDESNPVNSFASKIWLGYALGVFGPATRADLTCIKNIRNFFAHSKTARDFSAPEIVDACDQFHYINTFPWGGLLGPKPETAKLKFFASVKTYYSYFATQVETTHGPIKYADYEFPELYS